MSPIRRQEFCNGGKSPWKAGEEDVPACSRSAGGEPSDLLLMVVKTTFSFFYFMDNVYLITDYISLPALRI